MFNCSDCSKTKAKTKAKTNSGFFYSKRTGTEGQRIQCQAGSIEVKY